MRIQTLFVALCVVLLQSCAPVVRVDVDAIAAPCAKQKNTYVLVPGNENCTETDLQYQEFAYYTDHVLQEIGFTKAATCDDAEVIILLSYGISEPQVYEYAYSVPVVGQTGVECVSSFGGSRCGYASYSRYTPVYGVVGTATEIGTGVIFERGLSLTGIDSHVYRDSEAMVEVWKTKAVSIGESGDLRMIFPVMLAATKNHIAGSTGRVVSYTLRENDQCVKEIRNNCY